MTEFAFFDSKEERWGDNMRALWGDLSICPCLDHLELPYHTPVELLSISCLKVWGNAQEPHNDMAYLLVHTEGDSEAESYGMSLVWISPHQARVSTMEEALGTLSACISSGPDWLYVFAQLYKGSNHIPPTQGQAPRCLAPGKGGGRAPMGRSANSKSASFLSTGPQVIYPVGFEWVQPVSYHRLTRTAA